MQNSSHSEEFKNCNGEGFWEVVEGLHDFVLNLINLLKYNIVKIKLY